MNKKVRELPFHRFVASRTALCLLAVLGVCLPAHSQRRHLASHAQFLEAQKMQLSLEQQPENTRKPSDYEAVVTEYRKVYFTTPSASDATRALMAIGNLYRTMGQRFDKKYFHAAIVTYDFLLRQYPTSQLRPDAAFAIAQIEGDDLHSRTKADVAYRYFLKEFPDSPKASEARAALSGMNSPGAQKAGSANQPEDAGDSPATTGHSNVQPEASDAIPDDSTSSGPLAEVQDIHSWEGVGHTRIVVYFNKTVKFEAGHAYNPDRIFFDLQGSFVRGKLANNTITLNDGRLQSIRVGQHRPDVVRIVLDVAKGVDASSYLLQGPDRLVIDVQRSGQSSARGVSPSPNATPEAADSENGDPLNSDKGNSGHSSGEESADDNSSDAIPAPRGTSSNHNAVMNRPYPPAAPRTLHDGKRSLTRELGLKINRIVIDPGHGGYDTGTIGPHGLMEKNVCLDVARRLGALIQRKLPGAEVIYTRKTDVFIPLEERTAIANRAKADLFISIHANSSPNSSARGVETYYLNFATSPDAMQVAARENATSQSSVHELQTLIQKIARNEKIDESREFAADVQEALAHRLRSVSPNIEDRGVKRAPFVVLIGAKMPSILTEISFLSNPTDARLLHGSAERERIAEGIYRGIADYLESMNSLAVNMPAGHSAEDSRVAPGRNRK